MTGKRGSATLPPSISFSGEGLDPPQNFRTPSLSMKVFSSPQASSRCIVWFIDCVAADVHTNVGVDHCFPTHPSAHPSTRTFTDTYPAGSRPSIASWPPPLNSPNWVQPISRGWGGFLWVEFRCRYISDIFFTSGIFYGGPG